MVLLRTKLGRPPAHTDTPLPQGLRSCREGHRSNCSRRVRRQSCFGPFAPNCLPWSRYAHRPRRSQIFGLSISKRQLGRQAHRLHRTRQSLIHSMFHKLSITALVSILMSFLLSASEALAPLVPSQQIIPQSLFGMHIHRANSTTPWPSIPIGEWRLWDAYVTWPYLEPHKGQFRFDTLDAYVSLARQHNTGI